MSKTVQTIQFNISTQFKHTILNTHNFKHTNFKQFSLAELHSLVLFNPYIGPYQVLLLQARVDQGVMAMKEYSTFPEAPTLRQPHHQIV